MQSPRNVKSIETKDYRTASLAHQTKQFNQDISLFNIPSMSTGPGSPCAHAVIGADEVVALVHGIVSIRESSNELSIDKGAAISTSVMSTEGI